MKLPAKTFLLWAICALALPAHPQHWVEMSSESANSHLLRKVEPTYPAFAKAAGIQGLVRLKVGIYDDGRLHSIYVQSGPPALSKAAKAAASQYVYRPFIQDGRSVNVSTTLDIHFRIKGATVSPPPPPHLSFTNFYGAAQAFSTPPISPALRSWLMSYLHDLTKEFGETDSSDAIVHDLEQGIVPDAIELSTVWNSSENSSHIYVFRFDNREACGATGNCPEEILQEDARGVQLLVDSSGSGIYVRERAGADHPDIFISSHMAADEIGVVGYSEYGGQWGQMYCGDITTDENGKERDSVAVCQ